MQSDSDFSKYNTLPMSAFYKKELLSIVKTLKDDERFESFLKPVPWKSTLF